MRNALALGNGLIVTTDNSGGIGEKTADVIQAPDSITAYFSARVALLEQWAAHAEPIAVLIHNFSGISSWDAYVKGITTLFDEAGMKTPEISGSSETNIALMQSALAVTMIGQQGSVPFSEPSKWFTYGNPLVGNEVLKHPEKIASLKKINNAKGMGLLQEIWPVGSQGILHEVQVLTGRTDVEIETELDILSSAGPSTVVLVSISETKKQQAQQLFGELLQELHIN